MNRIVTGAALLLGVVASAGVVYSSVQLCATNDAIDRIEQRLAKMETAAPEAGPSPGPPALVPGGTDSPEGVDRPVTLEEAIAEVVRLREDLAVIQGRIPVKGVGESASADPSDEKIRKSVEDYLTAKEKERAEADKKRSEEWAKARLVRTIDELAAKLALSAQQKAQVTEILTAASSAQMDLWTNRKDGENPWQKSQEMRKESDEKVKQLLTAEQQGKYDEYMKTAMTSTRFVTGEPGGGVRMVDPVPPPR